MRLAAGGVLLILIALWSAPADAEWERSSTLLGITVGYAGQKADETDNYLNGGGMSVTVEHVVKDADWSAGVMFSYISANENVTTEDGDRADIRYNSSPIWLTSRFWFGGTRVRGSAGLGFGWYTGALETTVNGEYTKQNASGITIAVPIGLIWFLGESFYLNGSVQPILVANSFYTNDVIGMANLGVGFKI